MWTSIIKTKKRFVFVLEYLVSFLVLHIFQSTNKTFFVSCDGNLIKEYRIVFNLVFFFLQSVIKNPIYRNGIYLFVLGPKNIDSKFCNLKSIFSWEVFLGIFNATYVKLSMNFIFEFSFENNFKKFCQKMLTVKIQIKYSFI